MAATPEPLEPTAAANAGTMPRLLRRFAFPVAFAALLVLHVALVHHFAPPEALAGSEPVTMVDPDTPPAQARRVVDGLAERGVLRSYDAHRDAGAPAGTVFDAASPAWTLCTWALTRIGVPFAHAYNLFVLLVHLLVPLAAFAAARLFRLGRWLSWLAAALAVAIWFFDATTHWSWWLGRVGWAAAAVAVPLALALLHRAVEDGRIRHAVGLAVMLALVPLLHPLAALALLPPLLVVWIARAFVLDRRRHIGLAGALLAALLANAWWIVTAVADAGAAGNFSRATGGLSYLYTDLFGLMGADPLVSGVIANRTGFRLLALAAAVLGLVGWRRSRDPRFAPLAAGLAATLGLAYLGAYVPLLRDADPYRFVLPAAFLALPPGVAALGTLARDAAWRSLSRLTWALLGLGALVALPTLARDVIYFFPSLIPDATPDVLTAAHPDKPRDVQLVPYRLTAHAPGFAAVARWVEEQDPNEGRVVVDWPPLAEYVLWRTEAQVLGVASPVHLAHTASDLFRRLPDGGADRVALRAFLRDYVVRWIVLCHGPLPLERATELLEPLRFVPPQCRIYRVREEPSWFAANGGRVDVTHGGILVRGTDPQADVVLRFHADRLLRCAPDCRLLRQSLPGDPVGFVRVPAPHPADFALRSSG
jgi:hypothetical protein